MHFPIRPTRQTRRYRCISTTLSLVLLASTLANSFGVTPTVTAGISHSPANTGVVHTSDYPASSDSVLETPVSPEPTAPASTLIPSTSTPASTYSTSTAAPSEVSATSTSFPTSTSIPSPSLSPGVTDTGTPIPTPIITGTPPLTYTIGVPTPAPSLTPIPDTNYTDQAIEGARSALITEIDALPALTSTITGTLVTGLAGGRITSTDGSLLLGMRPGTIPVTDTISVRISQPTFQQGDLRASRGGQPLAYTFELTATNALSGEPVTQFGKDAVLVWSVDPSILLQAGIRGTYRVYTFNEQSQQWDEVLSRWDSTTNQLLITTPHFSLYGVGDGFDKVNNYVPTLNNFETDLQSGSASINYPINVPAGPAGFGPKVSLSYSSSNVDRVDAGQQGSSSVGWGWSLSGSYIAATQHTFDSYAPWTASIAVDGVNGDLVKGSDGRWHTSIESFARIEYHAGSGGNRATDYWEAWDKSGTHYVFNLNALLCDESNGRHASTGTPVCPYNSGWDLTTYKWMLSTATDVYGNTITYSYKYQKDDGSDTLTTSPITNTRTRATYPYEINYGSGGEKIKVAFDVTSRVIDNTTDVSYSDSGGNLYQSYRIDRIEVQRKQQSSGNYQLLRAYDLIQNYEIKLGTRIGQNPPPDPHLTLAAIRPWGNDGVTQLPDTILRYVVYTDTSLPQYDWGHIWWAYNGYGGEVGYYYDAASSDVNRSYRRVRAKKIGDGLGTDPPHRVTYYYDYRGAQTNSANVSAYASDITLTYRLNAIGSQFRGYAWVREQDPTGQMVDHYFQQDDSFKAKEWRVQAGKAETFSEYMTATATPTSNTNWNVSGGVVNYWDPNDPTNNTWKVPVGASFSRTTGVLDGSDVAMAFMPRGTVGGDDAGFISTLKLESGNGNGDYWGIQIFRRLYTDENVSEYRFYTKAIWSISGVTGTRELGPLNNTLTPRQKNELYVNEWYWVRLHTSPDGRFAAEIYRDDVTSTPDGRSPSLYGNYIQIKSGDTTSTGTIPTFPTGVSQGWKFKHEVTGGNGSYYTLADRYTENRTVYSQSDTWYAARDISTSTLSHSQPLVGLENNCDGMDIQFLFANRTEATTYGAACCELGQMKRSKTVYDYDTYGNQSQVDEYGDIATTGDERETLTSYVNVDRPTLSPPQYFIGKVGHTDTYQYLSDNSQYRFVARTQNYYDYQTTAESIPTSTSGLGRLTKSEQVPILGGVENGTRINQQFWFDTYGNSTTVQDANGNQTTTGYDTYYHSFPISTAYSNGRSETTAWDYTVDMPSETMDVNGTYTEFRYDAFGRPARNWTIGYGSDTSPNQRYGFTDLAHATVTPPFYISYTVALGTQAGSNDTTWQMRWYDGRGRTLQDVSPKDSTNTNLIVTDTGYNDNSQVSSSTLPYSITGANRFAYNTPDTSKPKMVKLYDGLGRSVEVQNPDYDATNNPNSHVITDYNWMLWTGSLDENGHYKWQRTDMLGRMDMVKEQDVIASPTTVAYTTYSYDMLNHLTQVTRDSGGSFQTTASTMTYDGLGRKVSMTDADMGSWQYAYDAAGNLTLQKDALYLSNPTVYADHQVFFKYDSMNRILEKYYGATHWNSGTGGTPDVKYYYDNALGDASTKYSWGKLRSAEVTLQGQGSDKANGHSYAYDPRGLLTSEVVTTTLSTRTYTSSYAYDTGGRMYQTTYPDPNATPETVSTHYNSQGIGLPDQLTSSITTNNPVPVQSATYNQRGQMLTLVQGTTTPTNNQLTTTYTYDDSTTKRGWLTNTTVQAGSGNTTILNLTMGYTLNGNISSVAQSATDTGNTTFSNSFTYDGLDRLMQATSTGTNGNPSLFPQEQYTFDSLDRMETRQLGGGFTNILGYSDPAHLDATTAYNGEQYGYDPNGNQTVRNTTSTNLNQTRLFDPEGRVSQIISNTVSGTDPTITDFIYDANGQRLIKSVSTPTPTAGLRGEYYDNSDLTSLKMTRYDGPVDFNWGGGSPDASIGSDTFSVRWTGQVQAVGSGTYTFYTDANDGVKLWVNSTSLISDWNDHTKLTTNSGTITLTAGQKYSIELDYYENTVDAAVTLSWLRPCGGVPPCPTKVAIPLSNLFAPVPSNGSSQFAEGVAWSNLVNVTSSGGNAIEKTSGSDGWNSGASSTVSIPVGADGYTQDGYMQSVAVSRSHHAMFGLSNGDQNQDYSDIDYAIYLQAQAGGYNGDLVIYEAGTEKYRITSTQQNPAYVAGDILKVSVEGGYVKYYKNGTLMYTSTTRPTTSLVVDTSLYDTGAKVKDTFLFRLRTQTFTQRTLYIGGMYEEELVGPNGTQYTTSNAPYTSYYSFGGNTVGMRRVNYTTGNGQYRMVSDHLGSTTLVVDTASPPMVASREYHKPYGEVAWSGGSAQMTSLTTIGYTGQRLDTDSELMYYGARFYDPVLSHFVSADTIAPDPTDAKTRNRYSYVLSNPLRYNDPTGHCVDQDENGKCHDHDTAADIQQYLKDHGITIGDPEDAGWTLDVLIALRDAIDELKGAAGWSIADFRSAMGVDKHPIMLYNSYLNAPSYPNQGNQLLRYQSNSDYPDTGCVQNGGCTFGGVETTLVNGNRNVHLDLLAINRKHEALKRIFVHELAHVWDFADGGSDTAGLAFTKILDASAEKLPSQRAEESQSFQEWWAEAVTAMVYKNGDYAQFDLTGKQAQYVTNQFRAVKQRKK